MNLAVSPADATDSIGAQAGAVVEEFLRIIMIPDPASARAFVAPDLQIRFTGGRPMSEPGESSAFNASRYAWVKKRFERTDVVVGASAQVAVVLASAPCSARGCTARRLRATGMWSGTA